MARSGNPEISARRSPPPSGAGPGPAPRRPIGAWALGALTIVGILGASIWVALAVRKPADHWDEVARAQAFFAKGRPDLAFQAVSGIRDEAPGAAEALTLAARAMLTYGNVSVARRSLERSLALQPKQPEAARMLAAIYLASGDGPRGVELLKQAAALDTRDFRPWYALGKVYHDLGELSDAADAYAEALDRSPPEPEATESRIGLVRALLDANRQDEATEAIAEARTRIPTDPRLLGLVARHAGDQGRSADALEAAEQALASDPENFDALTVRARMRHLAGRPEEALRDLEHAYAINPNHLGTLQLLGQVQTLLGRSEEASRTQEAFQRARDRLALMDRLTQEINRNPDDPEPRFRMGQAAVEGKMETLARQCFQAALDVDPDYRPAREALERLGIADANRPGALPHAP